MDVCTDPINQFRDFIGDGSFPCVGAKSALATQGIEIVVGTDLRKNDADDQLLRVLHRMPHDPDAASGLISTVALFPETPDLSEAKFETALWERLQALHETDISDFAWDPRVSSDPKSADFGLSYGGSAFFVVGLHAQASRRARRAPFAMVAFNPHAQFRHLKQVGKYGRVQKIVRDRDTAIQGDINPMLAAHGVSSEASQYSGREVPADWSCPFRSTGA
jgi:FPC/CPF motif-containing protein YcgG